jgi:ATP-binding cassette subfamily F protein 3
MSGYRFWARKNSTWEAYEAFVDIKIVEKKIRGNQSFIGDCTDYESDEYSQIIEDPADYTSIWVKLRVPVGDTEKILLGTRF